MPDIPFQNTVMGRDFVERTMPRIADALDAIAAAKTAPFHETPAGRELLEVTLPFIARELQRQNDILDTIRVNHELRAHHSDDPIAFRNDYDEALEAHRQQAKEGQS